MSRETPRRTTGLMAALLLGLGWLVPVSGPAYAAGPVPAASALPVAADEALPDDLTPITGGPVGSQAVPITSGRYVDSTSPDDPTDEDDPDGASRLYRFTRTVPGSTIMAGATLLSDDVTRRNRLSMILAYVKPDGGIVRCGVAGHSALTRVTSIPLVTSGLYSYDRAECGSRDDLLLAVFANGASGIAPGTPYELDVWEVPPVTNLAALPSAGEDGADTVTPTTPTTSVAPGAWKSSASLLAPDESVHVDLPLGRVSWFAVPLAFNESVDAFATVSDPEGTSGGTPVEMRLVSPVGGLVGTGQEGYQPYKETATIGTRPVGIEARSYYVTPAQRTFAVDVGDVQGPYGLSAEPGYYYLAVWAGNITGDPDATVPMTLTPDVRQATSAFADGEDPVYAATPTPFPAPDGAEPEPYDAAASPAADASDGSSGSRDAAGGSAAAREADDDGVNVVLVGVLAGLAVLLAALGTVLLVRARRQPKIR